MKKQGSRKKQKKIEGKSLGALILLILIAVVLVVLVILKFTDKSYGDNSATTTGAAETSEVAEKQTESQALNRTEPPTTATADYTAPVIEGVKDIISEAGNAIQYKLGITVTDDLDPSPVLTVDNSAVNVDEPGTYEVIYTATDSAGNSTSVKANVIIQKKDANNGSISELMDLAKKVVDENINKDGSDLKKINQAFWWTKANIQYTGSSNKDSWIADAICGFKEGSGDCFTFFAVLKALLTAMDFETVDVVRKGGATEHFWLLVKYEGQYYHIDACPRNPYRDKNWYCFLRTDAELQEWSPKYENYYNFDTSLYPASATEPLNLGSMQYGDEE